jgi:hypothetical protein
MLNKSGKSGHICLAPDFTGNGFSFPHGPLAIGLSYPAFIMLRNVLYILSIHKMWYIYTVEDYSSVKKIRIMLFAGKWIELETIILNAISQAQKVQSHMFSFICLN